MEKMTFSLKKGQSLNRWNMTPVEKTPFKSPTKAFEADINLGEGYVQIVYPVREEFLLKNLIQKAKPYRGEYSEVYFPFENNRTEFSGFINTPHRLSCYGSADIICDKDCAAKFDLLTCGGVKIWLNGEEIENYSPYTRNIQSGKTIMISFKKGVNKLQVFFDELAERDVFYYFELRYKGEKELAYQIEVDGEVEVIKEYEKILKSLYFTKEVYYADRFVLGYDDTLIEKDEQMFVYPKENQKKKIVLKKGQDKIILKDLLGDDMGVYLLVFEMRHKNISIKRELFVAYYPAKLKGIKADGDINSRKHKALQILAVYGKDNINKSIAILETKGKMTLAAKKGYEYSLEYIKQKKDCADFYLPVMLRMLTRYKKHLSGKQIQKLKETLLDFRYWIDEPGNDVMWYFSENHAFLFHVSQYLTGYIFPNEIFTASKRAGLEQMRLGRKRLIKWFDSFFDYGYAEWNSITYIPIDFIGFFALYEMAPDKDIKEMSKKALEFTFRLMAYNNFNGIISASYGRAYEDSVKIKELTETSFIEWITAGKGFVNFRNHSIASYAISDYVSPDWYKDVSIKEGEALIIKLIQGVNNVNTYNFMTKDYCVSSVINYRPYEKGHQQHLQNATMGEKNTPFFINHPGERPYSGKSRPSYWAGNGTMPLIYQHKDVQLMIYKLHEKSLVQYIHAFAVLEDFEEYKIEKNRFFARTQDACLFVYFSNDYERVNYGANKGKELISKGLCHKIVIRCASLEKFGSFYNFVKEFRKAKIIANDKEFYYKDPFYGDMEIKNGSDFYLNKEKYKYNMKKEFSVEKVKA